MIFNRAISKRLIYNTWIRTPRRRHSTNILSDVFRSCQACGTPFNQAENNTDIAIPGDVRTNHKIERKGSYKGKTNDNFDRIFSSLDQDKKAFLQNEALDLGTKLDPRSGNAPPSPNEWATNTSEALERTKNNSSIERKEAGRKHVCMRCSSVSMGQNHENRKLSDLIVQPLNEEDGAKTLREEMIPQNATVVNVIDALDFPTTVDKTLSKAHNNNRVLWVVNKVDLLVTQQYKANERALPYVQRELARTVNAKPENVFVVSAKLKWGLQRLKDALGDDNYFVGYTNTGKTQLALSLAQKFVGGVPIPHLPQRKLGSNVFPWQTQRPFTYELDGEKVINDLPSYPELNNGTYGVLKYKMLNKAVPGKVLLKDPGAYNARRVVASRSHHVISLGGVLVIEKNSEHHIIGWPIAGDAFAKTRIYSSLDKVITQASTVPSQQPLYNQLSRFFYHEPESANVGYTTHTFKLFSGGLSIAVRGIGVMHLQAFGKIPAEGIDIKAHALKGVEIDTRENILPYLRDDNRKMNKYTNKG